MSSSPTDPRDLPTPVAKEVADGVFAYIQPDGTWWINNTGFVVGRTRVAAIDSCATEARTRALREAIAAVSPRPVRTLVNTHHHGDHTHGNSLFDDAVIVAHEKCRQEMLNEGRPGTSPLVRSGTWTPVDWGELELAPPFLTYADGITLYVDDLRCEIRHVGRPAHSSNDSIVWIPERATLFAGDLLFNGGTPFLLAGSVVGAHEVVAGLKDIPATTIVPGHGDVCGPEVIDDVLAYLDFVLGLAEQGVAAGEPPLDVARQADLGRFAELTDTERLAGNLHRAYGDLTGGPVSVSAALADMVTFNGGHPLTCLA
jgi:cyclase